MKLIKKVVLQEELGNCPIENGQELVNSMNSQHKITTLTPKLLIVGTITPPEGNGYYYTARRNRIYGYIDEALGTNLKDLKQQLCSANISEIDRTSIINNIKSQLKKKRVVFLDVIDQAIRYSSGPEDDLISFCTLDCNSFRSIKKVDYIICNSRNAMECYLKICESYEIPCKCCKYISQRNGLKTEWVYTIKKACD